MRVGSQIHLDHIQEATPHTTCEQLQRQRIHDIGGGGICFVLSSIAGLATVATPRDSLEVEPVLKRCFLFLDEPAMTRPGGGF